MAPILYAQLLSCSPWGKRGFVVTKSVGLRPQYSQLSLAGNHGNHMLYYTSTVFAIVVVYSVSGQWNSSAGYNGCDVPPHAAGAEQLHHGGQVQQAGDHHAAEHVPFHQHPVCEWVAITYIQSLTCTSMTRTTVYTSHVYSKSL